MLGKWHLGFCNEKYTPTGRGFDSFYGKYVAIEKDERKDFLDKKEHLKSKRKLNNLKRQNSKQRQFKRRTSRQRKTRPARVRPKEMLAHSYYFRIADILRENYQKENPLFVYLSLFTKSYSVYGENVHETKYKQIVEMDKVIGKVLEEYKRNNLYNNTIVLFLSDNGARPLTGEEPNFPLR